MVVRPSASACKRRPGFRQACRRFIYTENLLPDAEVATLEEGPSRKALEPPRAAIPILNKAIAQLETEENHPPLLTGFRASGWSHAPGPLRPLSTKHRGSVAHNWPTLITWALAFANSNSGNEIVRPETSGPARRELSPKPPNRLLRPFSVRRLRKSRAISDLGKPRRFAGTAWWRTQSRQTGLRRSRSLRESGKAYR